MKKEKNYFHIKELGENVFFFSPEDNPEKIQEVLDGIYQKQEGNHFGEERYAIYFMPGKYDKKIKPMVGFSTQISGLGTSPEQTILPFLNCQAKWEHVPGNNVALSNFWRGIENLTVTDSVMWAVSQASFMRKMKIEGDLYLHDDGGWASGGFMADCKINGTVDAGPQQQWLSRNSDWNGWKSQGWNMVFAGIEEGKAPKGEWPEKPYTVLGEVEEMWEKPYLVYDEKQGFFISVPMARRFSKGIDWTGKQEKKLSINEFYIATAKKDTSVTLNEALRRRKHLLFTPGIYRIEEPLLVEKEETVLLGMGLATLRSEKECECICKITGNGVRMAGILFDSGEGRTKRMLQIGEKKVKNEVPQIPIVLSDLFFRIGGAFDYDTCVETALEIDSDYVIGDNFWIWRADHGRGVGWNKNPADTGLVVNGDRVTIYALMVEHFKKHQVIWNGEEGKTVMYQCETPYDPPGQDEWMSHEGRVNGYASYVVDKAVKKHHAVGMGIYSYHRDAVLDLENAIEAPETEEVSFKNICTVMLAGNPGINHIINGTGKGVRERGAREILTKYP